MVFRSLFSEHTTPRIFALEMNPLKSLSFEFLRIMMLAPMVVSLSIKFWVSINFIRNLVFSFEFLLFKDWNLSPMNLESY